MQHLTVMHVLGVLSILFSWCAPAVAQSWVITGTVTDVDGDGIASVDIDLSDSGGVSVSLSGDVTDSDGAFTVTVLDVIPSGFYTIEFNAPELTNFITATEEVFLIGDVDLDPVQLNREWEVSGTVVDSDGVGIAGIDLQFRDEDGVLWDFASDDTDIDGNYTVLVIEGVWDIEYRRVDAGDPLVPEHRLGVLVDADIVLADVELQSGYTVTGAVEDSLGTALADVEIEVALAEGRNPISGASDVDGAFEFLLPAGTHELEFVSADATLAPALVSFFVDSDAVINDVGTVVLEDGVEVSGLVVDEAPVGVSDVDLDFVLSSSQEKVHSVDDNTDVDGNYLVVIPEGTYDVRFRPRFESGLAPAVSLDVVVSGDSVLEDVTLLAGNALTGIVSAAGLPLVDVVVTLVDSSTGVAAYVFGNRSETDGSYGVRQVSGTYDVVFTPTVESGYDAQTVTDVDLSADYELDIDLNPVSDPQFVRGDSNGSGVVDLADPIYLLRYIFNDGPVPPCMAAADRNGDDTVDIADAISAFTWLFGSGIPPADPFPDCGDDPGATQTCEATPLLCG